jgi:hydroxyacylglutathione hydrolase
MPATHSELDPGINISAIPAFTDNYIWLLRGEGNDCAVVDPGDATPVLQALRQQGLRLCSILLTHHHPDHIGGVAELVRATRAKVIGPDDDRISGLDVVARQDDRIELPELGLEFQVIEVPGHTRSHIAYFGHHCLFSGDTLFSVGCGRLFEGTAEQMQVSLDKLAALPGETRLYCGHEYTLANCRFALAVEPHNSRLQEKTRIVETARAEGKVTLPGTLQEERLVNPFLRSRERPVIESAQKRDASAQAGSSTLRVIREWKDTW